MNQNTNNTATVNTQNTNNGKENTMNQIISQETIDQLKDGMSKLSKTDLGTMLGMNASQIKRTKRSDIEAAVLTIIDNHNNAQKEEDTMTTQNTTPASDNNAKKEEEKKAMEAKKQAEKEAKAQAKKAEAEKKAAEKAKKAEERKAAKEKAEEKKAEEKKAAAAKFESNQNTVLDALGTLEGVTLETYPNLPDWIKVQQAGKTALEIRFGKKELRMQADEKDAALTEYTYKVVKSFSKSATFQFQYNDPTLLQAVQNLLQARAQRLADAKAAKEKAKAEEKAKKAAEKAAKKAAKDEEKKEQ